MVGAGVDGGDVLATNELVGAAVGAVVVLGAVDSVGVVAGSRVEDVDGATVDVNGSATSSFEQAATSSATPAAANARDQRLIRP